MRPDLSDGGEMGEIKPAGRTGDRNVSHVPNLRNASENWERERGFATWKSSMQIRND